MSKEERPTKPTVDLEACVRGNTGSAALAAGLLIFFGYFWLAVPSGTDAYSQAAAVFVYTLRIGGLAMALIAGWCSFGQPLALLGDAVVSCIIGAVILVAAAIMMIDGGSGTQSLIAIVCAIMFISVGLRNGRDFLAGVEVKDEEEEQLEKLDKVFDGGVAGDLASQAKVRPKGRGTEPNAHLIEMKPDPARTGNVATTGRRFAADDEAIQLPDTEPLSLADVPPPPPQKPHPSDSSRTPGSKQGPEGFLADLAEDEHRRKP